MLFKDGKLVNLSRTKSGQDAVSKKVWEIINQMKKELGNTPFIAFEYLPKYVKRDEEGNLQAPTARYYSCIKHIEGHDALSGTWVYSESTPKRDDSDNVIPVPHTIKMPKVLYIPKEKIDLAFWLYHIESRYSKDGKRGDYQLVNPDKKSKERIRYKKLQVDVNSMIVGSTGLSNKKIREIAAIWGVTNIMSRDIELIKDDLLLAVEAKERDNHNNGFAYEKFMADINFNERIKFESLVKICEDENVIIYDDIENSWKWSNKAGNLGANIVNVRVAESKYTELIDYILVDDKVAAEMQERLNKFMSLAD